MWFYTRPVFGYRRCYPDTVYAFRLLIVALERVENDKRKKKNDDSSNYWLYII